MVLQNYQKCIALTSNIIYIVALGVGFKCPRKIDLNTQCPGQMVTDAILEGRFGYINLCMTVAKLILNRNSIKNPSFRLNSPIS